MKKILLIVAVAGLSLVSCKKDYTCTCTSTVTVGGSTTTTSASSTVKDTKKNAEEACEKGTVTTAGGSVKCELK